MKFPVDVVTEITRIKRKITLQALQEHFMNSFAKVLKRRLWLTLTEIHLPSTLFVNVLHIP